MNTIDVSVVVPTFRRAEQLREALSSALSQDGIGLEVHVVDDSPEGSARDVALSFRDPRVSYTKRVMPSGGRPGIVRNEAWPRARGRYVQFLDDDDVLMPGAYRMHVDALEAHPYAAMSFGRIDPFCEDAATLARERAFWEGGAERARTATKLGRYAVVAMLLFDAPMFQNSACMVRKAALEETAGFDPLMPLNEDTEMHVRGIRSRGCVFIDRTVVRYRVNPGSLMRQDDSAPLLRKAYERMHGKYLRRHGSTEFLAMKLWVRARTLMAWGTAQLTL
jgi:glycosyltransferase involved in cell wall biosynthesis